ncbi:MAG: hypothetical protein KatS3mg060_1958 [Dehalococcoidia bacterium]|nr:MAG: hypothetical protein KatS3mg060_1958 [Dehalococcoidia bacterium]
MKGRTAFLFGAVALGIVLTAPRPGLEGSAWREPIWSVISGGGGRASGATYAVDVVIGQPFAGPTTSTNRSVFAGFLQNFGLESLTQFAPFLSKNTSGG